MAGPRWREIAEDLRKKIESNSFEPGSQLPNEFELCEEYNASRNTVRDAVGWLVNRGLVDRKSGKGTFVVNRIDPFITRLTNALDTGLGENVAYMSEVQEKQREPRVTPPRVEVQMAEAFVARMLNLQPDDQVVSRHQRRYIDDKPYSMQTSYYPMSLVTAHQAFQLIQAADIPEGTIGYLRSLGVSQVGYRDLTLARPPLPDEISFFDIPEIGVPILEHRRTSFNAEGERFRLTQTVYPADRNRFATDVGTIPPDAFLGSNDEAD